MALPKTWRIELVKWGMGGGLGKWAGRADNRGSKDLESFATRWEAAPCLRAQSYLLLRL